MDLRRAGSRLGGEFADRSRQTGSMRAAERIRNRIVAATTMLLALAACSSHGPTADPDATGPPVSSVPGAVPRPDHVLLVVLENKDRSQVIGSPAAPYLTSLAHSGATFVDSRGIAHPSQPNYVALLSGSTHGITDDSCPQDLGAAPNLARALLDAGHTFVTYSESMAGAGFTGCSAADGSYVRKHNPAADFSNIPAGSNRSYAQFPADYAALPTVSLLVPNMCHDMHDCPVSTGDSWASAHLSGYAHWAMTHNSLLIVTFDEDSGTPANRIPTIFAGPMVRPGPSKQPIDQYNLLRTLEDFFALPPLGRAASAAPITGIWRG